MMGGVGGGIREDSPYPDWAAGLISVYIMERYLPNL
jgi:hypothetical protein